CAAACSFGPEPVPLAEGPAQWRLFTAYTELTVGSCGAAELLLAEVGGSAAALPDAQDVSLGSYPNFVTYYQDAGCTQAIERVSYPAGQAALSLYFRAETAGDVLLFADSARVLGAKSDVRFVAQAPEAA